jgi:hypothetical protein
MSTTVVLRLYDREFEDEAVPKSSKGYSKRAGIFVAMVGKVPRCP